MCVCACVCACASVRVRARVTRTSAAARPPVFGLLCRGERVPTTSSPTGGIRPRLFAAPYGAAGRPSDPASEGRTERVRMVGACGLCSAQIPRDARRRAPRNARRRVPVHRRAPPESLEPWVRGRAACAMTVDASAYASLPHPVSPPPSASRARWARAFIEFCVCVGRGVFRTRRRPPPTTGAKAPKPPPPPPPPPAISACRR